MTFAGAVHGEPLPLLALHVGIYHHSVLQLDFAGDLTTTTYEMMQQPPGLLLATKPTVSAISGMQGTSSAAMVSAVGPLRMQPVDRSSSSSSFPWMYDVSLAWAPSGTANHRVCWSVG